jgi:hypothetical protein
MWMKHNISCSAAWQQLRKALGDQHAHPTQKKRWTGLAKKLGIAGFLFFFIKGLLWLVIPTLFFLFRP